ncbi:4,5-9,10-diseco-3-hydroxy-5,9,17-trioxoandrosta-1(10),2-diene-4-oate hydrolase [Caldovatus sediminis]|uniref:4,5-9,10-diseco-3-hydroxy-5,9,17-trioxoandrosta-1(10),2-diene-4-oate hydrolase n=1 Tax=Caldovatus sediminis TaxID=2041189 RepID=A0A8J3EC43_9PROT|nr:4,5-9,10-diseco-3-hydroxy-5,9,17-trioxoandrosta-1(10),2-diene-4-oate hydrolase [Caldovatus sediminis]
MAVSGAAQAETPEQTLRRIAARARRVETPCGDGSMVWHLWGESGPALVLLHGGAGSWRHWVRTIEPFAARHRLLVPDLPGMGESADPPAPPGMAEIAAITARGIERILGPAEPYDLVGFSFGASVGGHIALLHGARMRSLTLIGPGGLVPARQPLRLERVRGKTGAELVEAHRTNLLRLMLADPASVDPLALAIQDWNASHSRLDTPALIARRPLAESLPQLSIPVNAVWGERDQYAYWGLEERIAVIRELCPHAHVHVVPVAGHWLAYEDAPAFNAYLEERLRAGAAQ